MRIEVMRAGVLGANCYVVMDDSVGAQRMPAVVIDPGGEGDRLAAWFRKLDAHVQHIINTHGHVDHISGNTDVHAATGADILVGAEDAGMLIDPELSLSRYADQDGGSPPADRLLTDGDIVTAGNLSFMVIHTPGHTRGGICLLCDGHLFSGDTLFLESIGRTDLPGGSLPDIARSIKEKLFKLPPETIVHPGHGGSTTIGWEIEHNPFYGKSI
jgi:hydroxyacylglutathione hydrolase